ncbi:MAG: response regulator [bacterium]|nr:response regulator [bacterium]
MSTKILILDDDINLCRVWTRWLEAERYLVLTANGGEEALALIQKEDPALLLIDVLLPKTDGITFAKLIRETVSPTIPVILMSAVYRGMDVKAQAQFIIDDFIAKPFEKEELISKIKKILPEPEAAPEVGDILEDTFVLGNDFALTDSYQQLEKEPDEPVTEFSIELPPELGADAGGHSGAANAGKKKKSRSDSSIEEELDNLFKINLE